jgi:hypothetical protein
MLNRIKAMWARLWRGRGRQTSEHGFYDQRAAGRYRSQLDIESARGESYGPSISPQLLKSCGWSDVGSYHRGGIACQQ